MKTKGENRRASKGTIVLEAQTLKEARDDPRRSGPAPAILLHDGSRCNGAVVEARAGGERGASAATMAARVRRAADDGSGSMQFLAGFQRRCSGTGPNASAGASAAGKSDRVGEVEERPSGFGDAGASIALRSVGGSMDGGWRDAREAAADAVADLAGATPGVTKEPGARDPASARAAGTGERRVRQEGASVAQTGETAGCGAGSGGYVLRANRSGEPGDFKAAAADRGDGSGRSAGAMAGDDSWHRSVFGDDPAVGDRRGAAFWDGEGAVQLRGAGALGAGIGRAQEQRRNQPMWIAAFALGDGGGGAYGGALFSGSEKIFRTVKEAQTSACGARGAGAEAAGRGLRAVAGWSVLRRIDFCGGVRKAPSARRHPCPSRTFLRWGDGSSGQSLCALSTNRSLSHRSQIALWTSTPVFIEGTGPNASAGASAAGKSDRVGEVEERPSGFGDAGASIALRSVAGSMDGGWRDAREAAADAVADLAGATPGVTKEPGARDPASARAAGTGERRVRQEGASVAQTGETAGCGAGSGGYVLRANRSGEPGDFKAAAADRGDGSGRSAGAMAGDDSWHRSVFGDDPAVGDRRGAAFWDGEGAVQLRGAGALGAGIGRAQEQRRNQPMWIAAFALGDGGGGAYGGALFSGSEDIFRTIKEAQTSACGARGAGAEAAGRGLRAVAGWSVLRRIDLCGGVRKAPSARRHPCPSRTFLRWGDGSSGQSLCALSTNRSLSHRSQIALWTSTPVFIERMTAYFFCADGGAAALKSGALPFKPKSSRAYRQSVP